MLLMLEQLTESDLEMVPNNGQSADSSCDMTKLFTVGFSVCILGSGVAGNVR